MMFETTGQRIAGKVGAALLLIVVYGVGILGLAWLLEFAGPTSKRCECICDGKTETR